MLVMRLQVRSSLRIAGRSAVFPSPAAVRVFAAAFVLFMSLTLTFSCFAQNPPPLYPVAGIVENSLTHEPIARALVDANSQAMLTDSSGRFELQLPLGTTGITVRRPGYEIGANGVRASHLVSVGPNMSPLTFYLTPSAGIIGHVTLSSGDDPSGLQFMLYRKTIDNGRSRWIGQGMATIGIDGSFLLPSLEAPASYLLCDMPSPDSVEDMFQGTASSGYPGACFPGDTDLTTASAAPLRLTPGQQAQIEIALTRQPFYPVEISVANSGAPSSGVQIFELSGRPTGFGLRRNQENGRYEISLPNGSYYAELRQWGRTQLYGRVDFTVAGGPLSGLTIVPAPVQPISVEIQTDYTANPGQIPGINIGVTPRLSGAGDARPQINLNWVPVNRPLDWPITANLRPVDPASPSDLYEVDPPPQGAYRLEATGFDTYVSSMTSGGTDLLRDPILIGPGNNPDSISITLRNDVGSLRWKIKTPPTGIAAGEMSLAYFYAIALSPNQKRIYQSAMPIQPIGSMNQGAFPGVNLLPLPPGTYLAAAFDRQLEIDPADAQQMSWLTSHGQTVTVAPAAVTDVQIDPISTDEEAASQ